VILAAHHGNPRRLDAEPVGYGEGRRVANAGAAERHLLDRLRGVLVAADVHDVARAPATMTSPSADTEPRSPG